MTQNNQASGAGNYVADETNWPLLKSERNWGQLELGIVLLVTATATWCYVIGEYVGYYLNFKQGFATMTAGSMIGMLIVALAIVPPATKYGIDSIVAARPQFGSRGWIITVFLQYSSIIGWNSILIIFFGKSVFQFLLAIGAVADADAVNVQVIATLVACALIFGVLLQGKAGIARVSNVLFFFIVGVGAWMVYLLLTQESAAVMSGKPAYASGSIQWDYVTGIELGVVSLLSWWPYIGAMVRVAPNAHTATKPAMLGMGLPVPLLSVIGLAAILALGTSDPSTWMVKLGGAYYGTIALLFVIAANLGTAIVGVYATAVGLQSVPGVSRLPWSVTMLFGLVPVAIVGVVVPDLFFNNFGSFLAFIGVFFAPLCGIQIVDYFLLRGQKLSIRSLYDGSADSDYAYWGGFNPAALAGMAAGFATYLYLLNPLTYVSRTPYEFTTASLPAMVIGGLVFWLVTVAVVKPAGRGGYGKKPTPKSLGAAAVPASSKSAMGAIDRSKRVAVLGAGPCGLSVLRAFESARRKGTAIPEIVCFEKQDTWGGLWNYNWRTGTDEHGEPVHGSMYRYLWSNGPKEALEFADYTFDEHFGKGIASYPPREVLFDYIKGRVEKTVATEWIRYNTAVRWVEFDKATQKFTVTVYDFDKDRGYSEEFDYVFNCSGHFSTPYIPEFPGLPRFQGRVLHAHDVRDALEFKGLDILIVGASYSAEDIGSQCWKYGAKSITSCYRTQAMGYNWPENWDERPNLERVEGKTCYFKDGSSKDFDAIILCTGYLHHYPYLPDELTLKSKNRFWPLGLYQGVAWTKNPKFFYIGPQDNWFTFNMFDAQAWWARDVVLGRIKLPSFEAMEADCLEWRKKEEAIAELHQGWEFQGDTIKRLLAQTDYPAFNVDAVYDLFWQWKKHKLADIMGFRNNSYRSVFTGKVAPPHHTPWKDALDDSMAAYIGKPSGHAIEAAE